MPKCPICAGGRIVVMVNAERRAFCLDCGSRWTQQGGHQGNIQRAEFSSSKAAGQ